MNEGLLEKIIDLINLNIKSHEKDFHIRRMDRNYPPKLYYEHKENMTNGIRILFDDDKGNRILLLESPSSDFHGYEQYLYLRELVAKELVRLYNV